MGDATMGSSSDRSGGACEALGEMWFCMLAHLDGTVKSLLQ